MKRMRCNFRHTVLVAACALAFAACTKAPKESKAAVPVSVADSAKVAAPTVAPPVVPQAPTLADAKVPAAATGAAGHAQAAALAKAAEIRPAKLEELSDGAPLYDLELRVEDHVARKSGLDVFRGQPTLVTLFYASCPHACPLLISDLRRLEALLAPAVRGKLRVLLVSFDGGKDTPTRLAEMMKNAEVDAARWRMVRTDEDGVRGLAAALGIAYQKLPDGSYNHSSILTLVDGAGRIRARQEGLSLDMGLLAAKVASLAK